VPALGRQSVGSDADLQFVRRDGTRARSEQQLFNEDPDTDAVIMIGEISVPEKPTLLTGISSPPLVPINLT
jgi:succinyl-CoA synthetase alpha subunit